jgi:hypothetical protein
MYSVYRGETYASSLAIHFAPSCSSALTYQAYGLFWPQPLTTYDYSTGRVAVTANAAAVAGTNTTFTSNHVGAVIRFRSDEATPTDIMGEIDKNRVEPYVMQRVIKSRSSSTAITLEQDADTTFSSAGYRISSRIDIEPGAMRNAFLRCCEARFETQASPAADREARYEKALILAMIADQRLEETLGGSSWPDSLADIVASSDLTTGGTQP